MAKATKTYQTPSPYRLFDHAKLPYINEGTLVKHYPGVNAFLTDMRDTYPKSTANMHASDGISMGMTYKQTLDTFLNNPRDSSFSFMLMLDLAVGSL